MVHIQQANQRQYFSKEMTGHEVSNGVKEIGSIISNSLNTGISAVQKANESKLAENQIDLSTRFLQKNNEINTKWQADPTNPERENELKEAFEALASEYKINPLCQSKWNQIKNSIYGRFKTYNAQWAENQLNTNAKIEKLTSVFSTAHHGTPVSSKSIIADLINKLNPKGRIYFNPLKKKILLKMQSNMQAIN